MTAAGGVPWSGVAGVARGRHGGRVGCGAALPVIFWRSPGEGRWVTRGGVVLTVNGDRDEVERQLAGGELACPSCGGVLGGWGNARLRRVRAAEGPDDTDVVLVPRRSRCRGCAATHVLLPAWCLLRRADAAAVIGAALEAAAAGDGHRKIAGLAGAGGVDGAGVAAAVRRAGGGGAGVLHGAAGPGRPGSGDASRRGGAVAAAVSAIAGAAAAVAARWPELGEVPVWAAASAASCGLLLAPGWPGGGATRADPLRPGGAARDGFPVISLTGGGAPGGHEQG